MHNCSDTCEEDEVFTYIQKPQEKMDYKFDYKPALNPDGDTIVSSVWEIPSELIGSNGAFTDFEARIFLELSGDNPFSYIGNVYKISNIVTTAQGRKHKEFFCLKILEGENSC